LLLGRKSKFRCFPPTSFSSLWLLLASWRWHEGTGTCLKYLYKLFLQLSIKEKNIVIMFGVNWQ
jgi:hypothetical protein